MNRRIIRGAAVVTLFLAAFASFVFFGGDNKDAAEVKIDPRGEERTFASFPEWYIVYSAEEYGEFTKVGGRPSQFPFFASIGQYWDSLEEIKAALGTTEIDENTKTVLAVIGWSYSIESALIGAYEHTIGFVFELSNFFIKTNEDIYTEMVAREYGEFLKTTPWYAFPYFKKLGGLWTSYGLSSITPRGLERRIVFTVGYTLKGIYGAIIGVLTKSQLGNAELTTTFEVNSISAADLAGISGVTDIDAGSGGNITAVAPRYRAFTPVAEAVAAKGGNFVSIQGHGHIMFTILSEDVGECAAELAVLYSMPILTKPPLARSLFVVPVPDLATYIRTLNGCGISIEHIYDY